MEMTKWSTWKILFCNNNYHKTLYLTPSFRMHKGPIYCLAVASTITKRVQQRPRPPGFQRLQQLGLRPTTLHACWHLLCTTVLKVYVWVAPLISRKHWCREDTQQVTQHRQHESCRVSLHLSPLQRCSRPHLLPCPAAGPGWVSTAQLAWALMCIRIPCFPAPF